MLRVLQRAENLTRPNNELEKEAKDGQIVAQLQLYYESMRTRRYVFLSLFDVSYSRSGTVIEALRTENELIVDTEVFDKITWKTITRIRRITKNCNNETDVIVISSPGHALTIFTRLFWRGRLILDAGWPLSDSSRIRNGVLSLSFCKDLLIDFLSFLVADVVILESLKQQNRVNSIFHFARLQTAVNYTGLNEKRFELDAIQNESAPSLKPTHKLSVVFRGSYNKEAGLEFIQNCIQKVNDNFELIIVCSNLPLNFVQQRNVTYITRKLDDRELATLYLKADFAISQFGDSSRLTFSIPHKIFEYAFFGVPTICLSGSATSEIFDDSEFLFTDRAALQNMLKEIEQLKLNDKLQLLERKERIIDKYSRICSQSIIKRNFENIQASIQR